MCAAPLAPGSSVCVSNKPFSGSLPVPGGGGAGSPGGGDSVPPVVVPPKITSACKQEHPVAAGETCSSIWEAANLDPVAFMGLNPFVDCAFLFAGATVCLDDGIKREALRAPDLVCVNYTAVEGDTCSSIGSKYDVSLDLLKNLNPAISCDGGTFPPGTLVCAGMINVADVPPEGQVCVTWHTVVPGDSCSSIASAAGLSLSGFKVLNSQGTDGVLDCSKLAAGQRVCVEAASRAVPAVAHGRSG
ncbi:hypothetical protein HYH03_017797 [Edaphochlamys debaryana]|uniref:LysM domain-containing protein n=1 Tax=Edaphochlamys debaryana TaxID=47281 RepID=A0A835XNJ1_9CHLO|nr:hypothetical protein HYH03_017797 [Edaphochlamys debaryana]|eukprot:KAG2483349.1 hypothetical protein HYH03_017797 [Edaphochlamys debaryana]